MATACVYGVKESWREGDADDDDTWEPWALNDDLYQQIAEYYKKNPEANSDCPPSTS